MAAATEAGRHDAPWRADAVPVTFGTITADCLLLGRREDAPAVRARIDDVARNRLPAAIAEALSPALAGAAGVIRINRIALDISLGRDALALGDLARIWAAEIVRAVSAQIAGRAAANVAWFADHGDFAAAYYEYRFGEAGHPGWAFQDFASLDLLMPAEAAVEILRARPQYLAAFARRAARRGSPGRLAARLGRAAVLALVRALAPPDAIAAERARIGEILGNRLAELPAVAAGGTEPVNPLAVALELLALDGSLPPHVAVSAGRLAAVLAEIARRAGTGAGPALARRLREALDAVGAAPGSDEHAVLAPWLGDAAGRTELRALLERMTDTPISPEADRDRARTDIPDEPVPEAAIPDERLVLSSFAGVALCLTTIRGLGLHRLLPPRALFAAASALPDPKFQPLARTDPGIAALFPSDPRQPEPDWPEVPSAMLEPLTPEQAGAVRASAGAERWALLVLARLARTLPGLEASSAAYMRRQFVHIGGALRLTPEAVEAELDPVPLEIVLAMAGATGWQGPVPWLGGRGLSIRIREAR